MNLDGWKDAPMMMILGSASGAAGLGLGTFIKYLRHLDAATSSPKN